MEKKAIKEFLDSVIEDFKFYVSDSVDEGHALQFEDHNEFLKVCLDNFLEERSCEEK